MTKQEALRYFRENIQPYVGTDQTAIRTAWNDWTDSLQKDGQITSRQYETWLGPTPRKTRDEYVLQGNYGHGWEDLTAESSIAEIRQRLREYRENEGGNYRTVKRRVRRDPQSKQGRRRTRRDPRPNINPVCPVGTQVQTLILSQQFFNQREAASWIRRHGFRLNKIDESKNFWRFRQQEPDEFEKDSFRTIRLRPGVEAVIGCPRN